MGREDDPGRTSKILFLADRASGGMRVKSAPFLCWTEASVPRVSRTVGTLEADPEGAGGYQEFAPRSATRGPVAWTRCA
jgi:hypothetical protein